MATESLYVVNGEHIWATSAALAIEEEAERRRQKQQQIGGKITLSQPTEVKRGYGHVPGDLRATR